jgi:biotin synthase
MKTLRIARDAGLELCTGGIIGLGETRKQRLELVLELAAIYPEEVTINMLVPVPGTPLELQTPLENSEIVRMFSVIRFLLPESVIKISGGRETNLEDSGEELLQSGANGIITSGYLTMGGNEAEKDREMIKKIGLEA